MKEMEDTPDDLETLMKLQDISGDSAWIEKERAKILDKAQPEIYNITDCPDDVYGEHEKSGIEIVAIENHWETVGKAVE